ncbi:MAG: PorV/PorQ family protein [Candidatus Cloacimonadaceae bacterium]|nr:PorV/PorQ family protein [Candidatus Cloacimonadaceae bacterium]
MFIRSKTLLITILLISASLAQVAAVNESAGTTGFSALKIVYSARAMALGQALTGIAENPDGLHFNPAAVIRLENSEIGSTYMNYFMDAQGGQVQYLMPRNKFIGWGFFMKYLNLGEMERTDVDASGNLIESGETFGAYNFIAGATMSRYISDAIDVGGTIKVIYDQIDDTSAAAMLLDIGVIHHPANEKVKVGVSARNIGRQISYYSDSEYSERLPLTFAAGLSYRFNERYFAMLDFSKASGENFAAKMGLEYNLTPDLQLRGGFRSNAADWNNGGGLGLTSGISLGAGWNWHNYRIDYGISSYGDLGLVNQVSLNYEF